MRLNKLYNEVAKGYLIPIFQAVTSLGMLDGCICVLQCQGIKPRASHVRKALYHCDTPWALAKEYFKCIKKVESLRDLSF